MAIGQIITLVAVIRLRKQHKFLKAVSDGSYLDIISQHIENLERDIAATSPTEVKSKLSKYSSSNLMDMRPAIIKYCKQKLPNMPKGKPSRRLNRQGGRTAIEKLAADIIVLIKSCKFWCNNE